MQLWQIIYVSMMNDEGKTPALIYRLDQITIKEQSAISVWIRVVMNDFAIRPVDNQNATLRREDDILEIGVRQFSI